MIATGDDSITARTRPPIDAAPQARAQSRPHVLATIKL